MVRHLYLFSNYIQSLLIQLLLDRFLRQVRTVRCSQYIILDGCNMTYQATLPGNGRGLLVSFPSIQPNVE
jgi:hypothetical protein